jgi:hypothetical protein
MTLWIQARSPENEEFWTYLEIDDEGWATRHVDLQGADRSPVVAASLAEVLALRDTAADPVAMGAYEQRYGVLAEGRLDGWEDFEGTTAIPVETFELIWAAARQHMDAINASPASGAST